MPYATETIARSSIESTRADCSKEASPRMHNSFAEPARTDVAVTTGDEQGEKALSAAEKLAALSAAVSRHPLNREILFKTLAFCTAEQSLQSIESTIESFPEYEQCSQNPYQLALTLVKAGGLETIERDADGAVITDEYKEGLLEDEIDDLVQSLNFKTTETGMAYVERNQPRARLAELLDFDPKRSETYIELLSFIDAEPRTYGEIYEFLAGKPALETIVAGVRETMQPSVFVDKLERAGALVWNEGWNLSRDGKSYLEDLEQVKETHHAR